MSHCNVNLVDLCDNILLSQKIRMSSPKINVEPAYFFPFIGDNLNIAGMGDDGVDICLR